jgi:hypothetical protein
MKVIDKNVDKKNTWGSCKEKDLASLGWIFWGGCFLACILKEVKKDKQKILEEAQKDLHSGSKENNVLS